MNLVKHKMWFVLSLLLQCLWCSVSAFSVGNYSLHYKGRVLNEHDRLNLPSPIHGKHYVIDGFPFNGEPMGHVRLHYLEDVVDLVVVVDAQYTHTGFKKPSMAIDTEAQWFQYHDDLGKVLKIIIHKFPVDMNSTEVVPDTVDGERSSKAWSRENYQRNIISEVLLKHLPEESTYVLLSMDCDEIPRKESIPQFVANYSQLHEGVKLYMMFFYYSFKWIKGGPWDKAIVVSDQFVRKYPETGLNTFRTKLITTVNNSWDQGWHCSYCFSPTKILNKMKSVAESFVFGPDKVTLNWVTHCVNEGIDILGRGGGDVMTVYDGKRGLPACKKCHVYHSYE